MKRHIACITILLLVGAVSFGQGAKEPFDVKKSSEELEIMKGILNTTLTFFVQKSPNQNSRWRFSNVDAFYLAGQGAVFVIPTSGLRMPGIPDFSSNLDFGPEFSKQMEDFGREISVYAREISRQANEVAASASGLGKGLGSGAGAGQGAGVASVPPTPPVPPAPPAPQIEREKLRKSVEEAQARVKKTREEAEATREKFQKTIAEAKVYLVEALANYGDSITTVKPEEYINIVLLSDNGNRDSRSDVISARKAWITDYKAGRLTMDAFKQKVIQYNQ